MLYGVQINQLFWDEVILRAKNNYGNWHTLDDARTNVFSGLNSVIRDNISAIVETPEFKDAVATLVDETTN